MPGWHRSKRDGTVRAFILDRYGSADRLRAGEVPDPQLREEATVHTGSYAVTSIGSRARAVSHAPLNLFRIAT